MSNDNQPHRSTCDCPRKQRDCYDKINTTIAVVGLIVLAAYTSFAGVQSCQLIKSTEATAASIRAWVIPTEITPPRIQDLKLNGSFPIYFKNIGKTPAFDLRLTEEFKYWDKETHYMPSLDECPLPKKIYAYGALGPDKGESYVPPSIDIELTPDQSAKLVAGKAALLVHACMGYNTVLNNNEGMTDYCTVAYVYGTDFHLTAPCFPRGIKAR